MKKLSLLMMALTLALGGRAQSASPDTSILSRPTVGIALGGGGAKGAAHIGVLRYLEEIGMPVDYVVGTSIGSIIGGFYSLGYDPYELANIISDMDWNTMMSDVSERKALPLSGRRAQDKYLLSIPFNMGDVSKNMSDVFMASLPSGFISGNRITSLFNCLSMGYHDSVDFSQLPIPFACVATDIISGDSLVLREGNLPLSIRSSMAIPGYFSPVHYRGKVLCDGGLTANLPVDICRNSGVDVVIGIDVSDPLEGDKMRLRSLPQLLLQYSGMWMKTDVARLKPYCDLYMHPDISGYSSLDFNSEAIKELIDRGYKSAQSHHDELMAIKQQVDPNNVYRKQLQAPKAKIFGSDTMMVCKVNYHGVPLENERQLLAKGGLYPGMRINREILERHIALIEGTGFYTNITYSVEVVDTTKAMDQCVVNINLEQQEPHNFSLGLRVDSEESAAILLHLGFNQGRSHGFQFDIDGRINSNPKLILSTCYNGQQHSSPRLSYEFHNSNFSLRENYSPEYTNIRLYHHNVGLSMDLTLGLNAVLSYGLEEDVCMMDKNQIIGGGFGYDDITQLFNSPGHSGAFFHLSFDNMNNSYFPTQGQNLDLDLHWRLSNAYTYQHFVEKIPYAGFGDFQLSYQKALSLGRKVALLPQLFSRIVVGPHQNPYDNLIGGVLAGRYMEQQIPFIGFITPQRVDDLAQVLRMDMRINVVGNHYLTLIGNYLMSADSFGSYFGDDGSFHEALGVGLRYSYKLNGLGPLSVDLQWSDMTHKLGLYFNFGCMF